MMFELVIDVLDGKRKGHRFTLLENNIASNEIIPWVLEDESLEFTVLISKPISKALLCVYHHAIDVTNIMMKADGLCELKWRPDNNIYTEKLFLNYFGLSELKVCLYPDDEEFIELDFQPMQIMAKQSSAESVGQMFDYLSEIPSETLYSVFSATKNTGGLNENINDLIPPDAIIEKLLNSKIFLLETLPRLFQKPITRLVPEHQFIPIVGEEELSDISISWLVENLSVLEPDENPDRAHILYEDQHYRAKSMYIPLLLENPDVYENQIIHGFLSILLRESQNILNEYMNTGLNREVLKVPSGYVSFFSKISKFKKALIGEHLVIIENLILEFKYIKGLLEKYLPVTRQIIERPILTPKARTNSLYRGMMIEIIQWHEHKAIDWYAHKQLFSIKNLPELFENYCFFRVVMSVNNLLGKIDADGLQVKLNFQNIQNATINIERCPDYWMPKNVNQHKENLINSEGYTFTNKYNYKERGHLGRHSRRQPDIVIQIKDKDSNIKLIVLDAKYTSEEKSFGKYLPELTMKYVHGIHSNLNSLNPVISLTILYPATQAKFLSFHNSNFQIFGEYPVSPSLQSLGIILGENRNDDRLQSVIKRLFQIYGILDNDRVI